jgi:flagellar hook assembly protein FlgD
MDRAADAAAPLPAEVSMHRFIIATAVLLVFPATALAVTTQQAQPPTISISANGAPRCTKLPFFILSKRHKVILRISRTEGASAKAIKHTRLRDVAAGHHTFGWCGKTDFGKTVKPGEYFWRVGATAKAGAPVAWSQFRHVNVKA